MNVKTPMVAFLLGLLPTAYLLGVHEARAAPAVPEAISAQRFVLVDATGKQRGVFEAAEGTARLALNNTDGKVVARLAIAADGNPEVGLLGADGRPRFRIGVGKDGVGFVLTDYAGNARAGLVASEGGTSFTLTDPVSGNTRVMLSAERGGLASVGVHDKAGEARTVLSVNGAGKTRAL